MCERNKTLRGGEGHALKQRAEQTKIGDSVRKRKMVRGGGQRVKRKKKEIK